MCVHHLVIASETYFGIAHYLDEGLKRRSVSLTCSRHSGSKTYALAKIIEKKKKTKGELYPQMSIY